MRENNRIQGKCKQCGGASICEHNRRRRECNKAHYQAFIWVLIDLIVELLVLIIKPFDNQTES
jgi:ribosomal protein S27AE